jgi:hypothetical protein
VAFLLTRFSGMSNWFQRKTFHHTRDPIYQRLIVAILKGYYVPPLRVAAVKDNGLVTDPRLADDCDWTLIDGLQRTTCYIIAVLMLLYREELVDRGCLDRDIWEDVFKEHVKDCDIDELLNRQQPLEVFYEIETAGVLHFMLLLNSAQRQMNAKIQLELMNIPLIKMLEAEGIHLAKEQEKAADNRMEKAKFKGSNLIVAVQGYLQRNPQVTTSDEKEAFLGDEVDYLQEMEDMDEVVEVLKVVTGRLHEAVLNKLGSPILSDGELFTTALMAAAAKYAQLTSFKQLMAALDRLATEIEGGKDVLVLDKYQQVYSGIKSGRGRKMRSTIHTAFLDYFRGNCKKMEWEQNAQIFEA